MEQSYNARCPAVKRLLKEAQELHESSEEYFAQPLEDNLFEWHFTVRGPPDTEFDGGIYHGRIIMPPEYPMKPPNIIFFTPNGRFETNKKICLSISGHHPESWQPSWSIRTALLAIIGFMPTPAAGTIGALDYTASERITLAKRSSEFECTTCGKVKLLLKERTGDNKDIQREAREVSAQIAVTEKTITASDLTKDEVSTENTSAISGDASSSSESPPSQPTSESTTRSENVNNSSINSNSFTSSQPNARQERPPYSSETMSLMTQNILLTTAVILLVALVIRRIFLYESDISEDVDDIII